MGLEVDLYRSDDYVRSYRLPLTPMLKAIFERLLRMSLDNAEFRLLFLPVAVRATLDGDPVMVNLRNGHGYVQVCIVQDGVVLYRHPHSVTEIIAKPLQRMLAKREPEERHWGFDVVGLEASRAALVRPHPEVAMQVDLSASLPVARMFHVEEVEAPEPPLATLADLGVQEDEDDEDDDETEAAFEPDDAETDDEAPGPQDEIDEFAEVEDAPVGVVLSRAAYVSLRTMRLSSEVEEGGFLVGHVFGNQDEPGNYLVSISAVMKAERTGASLLHFTFTGESFTRVSEAIARRDRDEELVGWYHSHLFPATSEVGLSSIDVELHAATFHQPWQLAGLINLTAGERVIRFYAQDHGGIAQMPFWVSKS